MTLLRFLKEVNNTVANYTHSTHGGGNDSDFPWKVVLSVGLVVGCGFACLSLLEEGGEDDEDDDKDNGFEMRNGP